MRSFFQKHSIFYEMENIHSKCTYLLQINWKIMSGLWCYIDYSLFFPKANSIISLMPHNSFAAPWYWINLYLTFLGNHFGSHPINHLIKWKWNNFVERCVVILSTPKWRQLHSTTKTAFCITKLKQGDQPSTKAARAYLAMNQNRLLNDILKQGLCLRDYA